MRWPAVPGPADALLFAVADQLECSQWWPPVELQHAQLEQLRLLLEHANDHVPFYAGNLKPVSTLADLGELPILRRCELQEREQELRATTLPPGHAPSFEVRTSGSLGKPVRTLASRMTRLMHGALSLRYHRWHRRHPAATLAALRRAYHKPDTDGRPAPWIPGYPSGPLHTLDVGESVAQQLGWLLDTNPHYLLTYPSNLRQLLVEAHHHRVRPPALEQVLTYGEVLPASTRALCTQVWDLPLSDAYSAQEVGPIAFQCPSHPHYHVQSEHVIVEVVDADDEPVGPGELGRVLVTQLHNFALPLIRYELGDWARRGEPCPCGRAHDVLLEISGRTRNMLSLPGGGTSCPRFETEEWAFELGVRQSRVIQRTPNDLEVELVARAPLTPEQCERVRESVGTTTQDRFRVSVREVESIPSGANGKFEEFLNLLT